MLSEPYATEQGTKKYFQWISVDPSKQRICDQLTVSALGAGTFLGPSDDQTDQLYEETLLQAALQGINFFDTAIHYRNQRSEKVLGKVIKNLLSHGVLREQIVISTKGGLIPFEGKSFEEHLRIHYLDKGILQAGDVIDESYCMTRPFLEDQISKSLKHLGLECIDLYYLQSPELLLKESGEETFYQHLKEVFALFERKVEEGKIRRYGICTWNGFRMKKGGLKLEKILACAQEAGGEKHHFKAIQIPFNLVMLEAIKQKIISKADQLQISVMVCSPLMQAQAIQLSSQVFEQLEGEKSKAVKAFEFILSTPKVCSAFCGMTSMKHLRENLEILKQASWDAETWKKACQILGVPQEKKKMS